MTKKFHPLFLTKREYIILYLIGALWLLAMIILTPPDKTTGTWGRTVVLPDHNKQSILLELNANGTEKIITATSRGSLVAIGTYQLTGINLDQSVVSIVQNGVISGPKKEEITGIYRCKISGDVLEIDGKALPLNESAGLSNIGSVTLTRLSDNAADNLNKSK